MRNDTDSEVEFVFYAARGDKITQQHVQTEWQSIMREIK